MTDNTSEKPDAGKSRARAQRRAPGTYNSVSDAAGEDERLSALDHRLLHQIEKHYNLRRGDTYSLDELARDAKGSRESAYRRLKLLVEWGYARRHGGGERVAGFIEPVHLYASTPTDEPETVGAHDYRDDAAQSETVGANAYSAVGTGEDNLWAPAPPPKSRLQTSSNNHSKKSRASSQSREREAPLSRNPRKGFFDEIAKQVAIDHHIKPEWAEPLHTIWSGLPSRTSFAAICVKEREQSRITSKHPNFKQESNNGNGGHHTSRPRSPNAEPDIRADQYRGIAAAVSAADPRREVA